MKSFLRMDYIKKIQIVFLLALGGIIVLTLKVIEVNWSNILEGLIVGIIITLVFTFWFPFLLSKIRRPNKLEMWDKISGGQFIKTSIKEGGAEREFTAGLAIANRGNIPIANGLYWHLYIPKHIKIDIQADEVEGPRVSEEENFTHLRGQIKHIIFPERATSLLSKLKGSLPIDSSPNDNLYYFCSTEFGIYPQVIKNEFKEKVRVNDMYFLKIR